MMPGRARQRWPVGYSDVMRAHLSRLAKLRRLPPEERRLLPVVAVLLGLARLGLSLLGVPRTRRLIAGLAPRSRVPAERLAGLVGTAGQALPGLTACLPRAIVLEALLARAGHAAELRVGVTPLLGRDRPEAHAWVELGGKPVAEDAARYTALPLFGTRG